MKTLRRVIRQSHVQQYLFINFFDPFFLQSIPDDIKPALYIYQCMDDISQVAYTAKHGVRLENEIVKRADVVLCTSRELAKLKSAYSANVHFHPNGADAELFKKAAVDVLNRPADMNFGDKKIIGFTGSIEYRTDFELLVKLARHHHDKILFFIGPVSGNEHIKSGLTKMPNVVFAGAKPLGELPAYLQYFDCCIIPYKVNTLTASIYPLKINEYLAAGKPVVSTNFSADIQSFSDVAYIVNTHTEFIEAIDTAIEENVVNKKIARMGAASANTWEKRVEQFWDIVSPAT